MSVQNKNFFDNSLAFLEKPASRAEFELADFMHNFFKTLVTKNCNAHIALYSDNARIQSLSTKNIISKNTLHKYLELKMPEMRSVKIEDIFIDPQTNLSARIVADVMYTYKSRKIIGPAYQIFMLQKESGKWLIKETRYVI